MRSLAWLRIVMSSITGMVLVMLERVRADSGVITLAVRSLAWLRIVMSSITGMVLVMLERVRADSGVITLL